MVSGRRIKLQQLCINTDIVEEFHSSNDENSDIDDNHDDNEPGFHSNTDSEYESESDGYSTTDSDINNNKPSSIILNQQEANIRFTIGIITLSVLIPSLLIAYLSLISVCVYIQ